MSWSQNIGGQGVQAQASAWGLSLCVTKGMCFDCPELDITHLSNTGLPTSFHCRENKVKGEVVKELRKFMSLHTSTTFCKASNSQPPHAFLSRKYKSPVPGCLRSEGAASHAIFLLFALLLTTSCNVVYLTVSNSSGLENDIFLQGSQTGSQVHHQREMFKQQLEETKFLGTRVKDPWGMESSMWRPRLEKEHRTRNAGAVDVT